MALSGYLKSKLELRLHTGNINAWSELKQKHFENTSDELLACLRLQLQKWKPLEDESKCPSSMCLFQDSHYSVPVAKSDQERSELVVSLKIFLFDWVVGYVRDSIELALKELQAGFLDKAIVAFPPFTDEQEGKELDIVKPIWQECEELFKEGKTKAIGVADLNVDQLRNLYDWSAVKPMINHYNIAACCTVPPELSDYAKQHNVQLLTHNDPAVFVKDEQVEQVLVEAAGDAANPSSSQWRVCWVSRYTSMIKERSVITSKGYVVYLAKKDNNLNLVN